MAVTSTIQIKRGTSVPLTLLSGEPALRTDTQDLYLGNGSTNTLINVMKIRNEHIYNDTGFNHYVVYSPLTSNQSIDLRTKKPDNVDNSFLGSAAVATGYMTASCGITSFAQGNNTTAMGNTSHVEGQNTIAMGAQNHAEGYASVTAIGSKLYRVSSTNTSTRTYTLPSTTGLSTGTVVIELGDASPNSQNTITSVTSTTVTMANSLPGSTVYALLLLSGIYTSSRGEHAEGAFCLAAGVQSHAEGWGTYAFGSQAHTEGLSTTALGVGSHAEGGNTYADGDYANAKGRYTKGNVYACQAMGAYNKTLTGNATTFTAGQDMFVIGSGTSDSLRANCFRVDANGAVYGLAAYNSTGADYAEMFEWKDGNINKEDRIGYFVTEVGNGMIQIAGENDYILGVVSCRASVIGNSCEDQWKDMYLTDEFGRLLIDEEGNNIYNSAYNQEEEYVPRSKRQEWDSIGLLGRVIVRDDGTCKINSYCKVAADGCATASDSGYRVIKRVSANVVEILFK